MSDFDLQKYKDTFGPNEGLMYRQWTVEEGKAIVAEVERLSGMEEAFFKSAKTIESLQSQLAAVEKELDWYKDAIRRWEKNHENLNAENSELVKTMASRLARVEELYTENAKLKEQVSWTGITVKPLACDKCGGLLVSIPRLNIYHVCPYGGQK